MSFTTQPSPRCRLILTAPNTDTYAPWRSQATNAFIKWSLTYITDSLDNHLMTGYPYKLPFSFADYEAKGLAADLEAIGFTTRIVPE